MRGWVFLPLTATHPIMLRGERGGGIILPILRILGGSIPLGLGQGGLSYGTSGVVGGGRGGDTPTGWIPLRDGWATPTPSGGMLADCYGFLTFAPIDNLARGA
jgi:hypothetical protein